jgi:hypothetical protein
MGNLSNDLHSPFKIANANLKNLYDDSMMENNHDSHNYMLS